ncbi:MAG TPA: hypothetical protein PLZ51_19265, partial [Aggregatilineales bacterium]|nr:hypothetical protein [Aggregatilineales bacterium]
WLQSKKKTDFLFFGAIKMNNNSSNYHMDYFDVTQHWHPDSERYAGGDALVTLLTQGWEIEREVGVEDRFFAGLRSISVYHLTLVRGGERMRMPVIRNPYINRLIRLGSYVQVNVDEMK